MAEASKPRPVKRGKGIVAIGEKLFFLGTGRRKTSVARVRMSSGQGKFVINERPADEFFKEPKDIAAVKAPLALANVSDKMDVNVTVDGGGVTGQAGAVLLGLGRALVTYDVTLKKPMMDAGFLTRDSRMKERKKYGQRGARRRFQFSKR
ncbi:MAG: 30S ribosomal protein S9 [Phycisphaerae bacterium]|jgi:small subunit ribosomal protein S9